MASVLSELPALVDCDRLVGPARSSTTGSLCLHGPLQTATPWIVWIRHGPADTLLVWDILDHALGLMSVLGELPGLESRDLCVLTLS